MVSEYAVLFAWSFLAATVLPLGSELAFTAVVLRQDTVLLPVVVATAGNALGAATTYGLGRKAAALAERRMTKSAARAAALIRRHGQPAVFFSWIPVIGDALVAAAGASAMPLVPFAIWMILGKALRYMLLAWSVNELG